jgi:hypothetical protein
VFPSTWEGFGNPVIESVIARRPLVTAHYPVLDELLALGFEFFSVDEPAALVSWLEHPETGRLDANIDVARRHFDLSDLPNRIAAACATVGWDEW